MRRSTVGFCVMLLAVFGVTAVTLQPDFVIQDFTLRSSPIPAILYQQPLLQASSNVPTPTPASNLVSIQSQGVTQADLNNRITGLLLHMHWLLNDRGQSATVSTTRTNSSESKRIDRLERQIFSFMDESDDDRSDLSDDITNGGSFLNPTLTTATLNGTTTAGAFIVNGRLGVGTSSPVERLSINGAVYLADTTPTNSASRLYNTAGGLYWNGSLVAGGAVGSWTGSGGNVYRASGNVGIGTSAPDKLLHIKSQSGVYRSQISIDDSANNSGYARIDYNTDDSISWNAGVYSTNSSPDRGFAVSNNYSGWKDLLSVSPNGNVGIGTTSSLAKLSVKGSGTGTGRAFSITDSTNVEKFTVLDNGKVVLSGRQTIYNADATGFLNSLYFGDGGGSLSHTSGSEGYDNTAVGIGALYFNTIGSSNTANGLNSLYSNTTGSNNSANGVNSLFYNTTGNNNTANGFRTLEANTIGYNNTANGAYALLLNTTGSQNTANGITSLYSNTTGSNNVANGMESLYWNTVGYDNTSNGAYSLYFNITGYSNTANGKHALYSNTSGYYNTANGVNAGRYLADGTTANQTSSNSVFEGYDTRALTASGTNEIVIGASAIGNGSNSATLGNDSITKTILKGSVGIGTTSPLAKLSVTGSGTGTGRAFSITDSANAEKFTVLDNGNLGIGTSVPEGKLTVNGSTSDTPGSNSLLTLYAGTGKWVQRIDSSGNLNFDSNNGASMYSWVTINRVGNVGIGTTSPLAKLSVKGSGTGTGRAFSITDSTNVEKFTVLDNGNVGIGTSIPTVPLEVIAKSLNKGLRITRDSTNNSTLEFAEIGGIQARIYGIGASSAGQMAFLTGSGGGSEAMRITDTGNVGIGTSSPKTALQVGVSTDNYGVSAFTKLYTSGGGIRVGSASGSDYGYRIVRDPGSIFAPELNGDLVFIGDQANSFGNYAFLNQSGSVLLRILGGGNVGIGTTSPLAKLSVKGSGTGAGRAFSITDSANVEKFTVLDNGNVGIGASVPGAKLDIIDESQQGLLTALRLGGQVADDGGRSIDFSTASALNTFLTGARISGVRHGGAWGSLRFSTLGADGLQERVRFSPDGSVGISTTTPNARLSIVGSGASVVTKALLVSDSNNVPYVVAHDEGGVTIGKQMIVTSLYTLDVGGSGDQFIRLKSMDNAGNAGVNFSGAGDRGSIYGTFDYNIKIEPNAQYGYADVIINPKNGSATRLGILDSTPDFGIESAATSSKGYFGISSTAGADGDIFMIDPSGNMGVGTTSPGAKLDVAGNVLLGRGGLIDTQRTLSITGAKQSSGADYARVDFKNYDQNGSLGEYVGARISSENAAGAEYGDLRFWTRSSTMRTNPDMILNSAGNVGIGTTSPLAKLSIAGNGTGTGRAFSITDSTNVEKFTVLDNGNVGIGTTTPGAKLAISGGNIRLDSDRKLEWNYGWEYLYANTSSGNITASVRTGLIVNADNNDNDLPTHVEFSVRSGSALSELFRIQKNGNVGIGTTSPNSALDVIGTIQASNLLGGAVNLTTDANGNIIRDPSDARLKENIQEISNPLDKLLSLHGVSYQWKDKERFGEQTEIGFIAQEVDSILPEVVRKGGEYFSLNTRNILAVVIEGFKELYAKVMRNSDKIDLLEQQNASLEQNNVELETRLEALEAQLNVTPPAPVVVEDEDEPEQEETNQDEGSDSANQEETEVAEEDGLEPIEIVQDEVEEETPALTTEEPEADEAEVVPETEISE
ncbi:tail fiber domain-containing protein [Candidatus Nomurabacteria bacterium]|nr:tail fiber domain-containing protein [Candidatus Nomurabacteria bacterium]